MNCTEYRAKLDDWLDGALTVADAARMQAHAGECASCAAESGRARDVSGALARYPVSPPDAGFADKVVAHAARGRKSIMAGRLVAGAFVATLMLSVVTVILTGLSVEAPRTQITAGLPTVALRVAEPRVVNLVFDSRRPLADVTLLITLPRGVELRGYPGRSQIEWTTSLAAGRNVLPVELTAADNAAGQLIAQLGYGELRKVFRIHLDVGPG